VLRSRDFRVGGADLPGRVVAIGLLHVLPSGSQHFFCTDGFSGRRLLLGFHPRGVKDFGVSRRSRVTGAHSGAHCLRKNPTTNSRSKSEQCRLDARALASLTFQPRSSPTSVPHMADLAFSTGRRRVARVRPMSVLDCVPLLVNAPEGEGRTIKVLLKTVHHNTRMNSRAARAPRVFPLEIPKTRKSAILC
jgi:hypothetical protein